MSASRDATIKHSVFYRTVILTFIPAIIVSCLSGVIYFYYLSWFKSDISHTYSERLQSVAETMDDLVLELYRSHVMLSLDPSIREIVVRSDFPFSERPLDVIRSAKLLGQYRLTREILDSVYIYHRPTGMVLTEQGTVGAAEFFGRLRVYEDRPMESWTSFEHQTTRFEFLPPSRVTESDQSARVISIVQEGVGPVRTDSLLVIDIRVEALDRMLASETFTPNSSLAIIDESGTLYASSVGAGWWDVSGFQDWQVIQDYALGHNSTGSRTIALNHGTQSEKAVLIYARSPMSLKRFVYIATVPFSDIRDRTAAIRYIAGLMILVGLATSFGIAVFVTSRQYRPIRALVSLLGRSGEQASESMAADDEYDYLSRNILGVLRAKREMEDELSRAIPLAVERCFVRLLRDDEADLEGDLHALLRSEGLDFVHNFFCAVTTRLEFTKAFSQQFSREERGVLFTTLARLSQSILAKPSRTYAVAIAENLICVVLNVEETVTDEQIEAAVTRLHNQIGQQERFARLVSGIGEIRRGVDGLRLSYRQAYYTQSLMLSSDSARVRHYSTQIQSQTVARIADVDMSKLMNLLVSGRSDEAVKHARELIERYTSPTGNGEEIEAVCRQLRATGIRALDTRQWEENEIMESDETDWACRGSECSGELLQSYVLRLFRNTANRFRDARRSIDIAEVLEVIRENYASDIYMAKLASRFNTSEKHLSRLFRERTGLPFYQFVTRLRIDKAKTLLCETEDTVNEIARTVGFRSESSFFRMFKSREGIPPSEYRRVHRDLAEQVKK